MLHGCFCKMDKRETIFYVEAILKNSDFLRQRHQTITTRVVWEKYVEMFYQLLQIRNCDYAAFFLSVNLKVQISLTDILYIVWN